MLLSEDSRNILFVGGLPLLLACLLLDLPAVELLLPANLGCLQALSLDEFGVPDLLVLLFLVLHDPQFLVFQDEHACLLQSLPHEDIKHGLNFCIEIKEIGVLIKDLGVLAVFLEGHAWLEEGDGRTIEIEFGSNAFFSLRGLVCEKLNIFLCLDLCVETAWHRLWGRNVTVRIDATGALWCSSNLHR